MKNRTEPSIANIANENVQYRQTSNNSRSLVDNKLADHSDVGAVPTTTSFST